MVDVLAHPFIQQHAAAAPPAPPRQPAPVEAPPQPLLSALPLPPGAAPSPLPPGVAAAEPVASAGSAALLPPPQSAEAVAAEPPGAAPAAPSAAGTVAPALPPASSTSATAGPLPSTAAAAEAPPAAGAAADAERPPAEAPEPEVLESIAQLLDRSWQLYWEVSRMAQLQVAVQGPPPHVVCRTHSAACSPQRSRPARGGGLSPEPATSFVAAPRGHLGTPPAPSSLHSKSPGRAGRGSPAPLPPTARCAPRRLSSCPAGANPAAVWWPVADDGLVRCELTGVAADLARRMQVV